MFNYKLKIEKHDGEIEVLQYSTCHNIDINHIIELKALFAGYEKYRVVSICHCDKGVILTLEKVYSK
jgi:hypothetical protein